MISIVIPSHREGRGLLDCIAALDALAGPREVVVAACDEPDDVRARLVTQPGVRWIDCPTASRALQLARGVTAARGDRLIFLHADTRLPADAIPCVDAALDRPGVAGGGFRLSFDRPHPALRLLERLSGLSWPASFLGDQALFCRRADYDAAGGFGDAPLMEDVRLATALARRGRLVRLDARVTTSARRFVGAGPWRQLATNAVLLALHHLGVPARRLARAYRP